MNKIIHGKILVSGSLVYDHIMDFPGRFKDHILRDKVHILNVSFAVNTIKESFGGTAGNIAYNLSLLGERPVVLASAGNDFGAYKQWFLKNKIDISYIKIFKRENTSKCYIITDKDDNQITSFYPGPQNINNYRKSLYTYRAYLAIISPDQKERMVNYAGAYRKANIPYIFDPGQQITALEKKDLLLAIRGAKILIGNDYEIQLIIDKLKINLSKLHQMVEILVITKGSKGSEIYNDRKRAIIPSAKPKKILDPTGAGDAYRAGLIKGLKEGWPFPKIGRFAGLVAVYAVEKYGTQVHRFNWVELGKRYYTNYKEKL